MEETQVPQTPALGQSTIHGLNIIWSFGIDTEPKRVAELTATATQLDDGAYLLDSLRAIAGVERRWHQYAIAKVLSLLRIEMLDAIRHGVEDGGALDAHRKAVRGLTKPQYAAGPPVMRSIVLNELSLYTGLVGNSDMGIFLRSEVVKIAQKLASLAESDTEQSYRAAQLPCVLYWKNWLNDAEESLGLAQSLLARGIAAGEERSCAERALTFAAHRAVSAYRELADFVAKGSPEGSICGQFELAIAALKAVEPNERTEPDAVHAAALESITASYERAKAATVVLDERRQSALGLIVRAQELHEQLPAVKN